MLFPISFSSSSSTSTSRLSMDSGEEQQLATKTIKFKQFKIIESSESAISDHYYKSEKNHASFNNPTNNVPKHIAKEWRILDKNLPESIYVRAYEQRIDLFRAMIIGSPNTPYHDGLFFFDIHLPENYPSEPPKVHYHSHGYRLNPNLYENGKVSLGLIKNWDEKGIEKWVPNNSTILQILLSIQWLVLNDKPYFNKPDYGHGKNITCKYWVKKYMSYNKKAFIMSCKTLLHNLNSPPYGFEKLVVEHCRQRGKYLLEAIKDYYNGDSVIGHYSQGYCYSPCSSSSGKVSSGDKLILWKMHSNIVQAFFKHQIFASEILVEAMLETDEKVKDKNPKKGIVGKIIQKFKEISA